MGDISPKNLLFSLVPHEGVYFIDCDAMRINGVSALAQMETPGWERPAGEDLATIYSDAYKLGLLALRLLAGDHDTKNLQHLPASTPGLLRQVITDTLSNPSQQRPLPEAWSYVLGHAIEHAQHQKKTATPTATPVSVAPAPPPTPVVHSRPPVGSSAPPAPAPPPPYSTPPPPPAWAPPPPQRQPASPAKIWAGVGVAAAIIVIVAVIAITLATHNTSTPTSAPTTSSEPSAYPSDSYSTPTSSPNTPTASVPPPDLVQTPDSYGVNCSDGYHVGMNHSAWATNAGRGTDQTSCQFANNVLQAYWNTYHSPSRDSRQVIVGGAVPCPQVSANAVTPVPCSGNDFVMTCVANGDDPWITCTGGNNAKVYIY
ncbi:hypothetical protein [Mycobacterium noviomagense]|uniref:Protein kinase domain-containing protein n=1 Tax=Mycobacterium noviomagense TaxID=459858 RepID=A0A7I7P8X2_9MYCO|nr:hypothetical protein [Mycobacterium noviomagense]BBY05030.1 hypothetical protein MNVI_03480 [Mycobacterium noviomagense]